MRVPYIYFKVGSRIRGRDMRIEIRIVFDGPGRGVKRTALRKRHRTPDRADVTVRRNSEHRRSLWSRGQRSAHARMAGDIPKAVTLFKYRT